MNSLTKLIPYLAILGLLVGGFFYVKNAEKAKCENVDLKAKSEGVINRENTDHENKNLDRIVIIERLADGGWLRHD